MKAGIVFCFFIEALRNIQHIRIKQLRRFPFLFTQLKLVNMKGKFYHLIPLFLVSFLSVTVMAQGDYTRRDRYSHDRYDTHDRNDRYDNGRGYGNRNYHYNEIKRRPHSQRYSRPMRPSSFHIWVEGDWMWSNGRYYYKQGYWAVPRHGYSWVPGHWERGRHGWYWVNGFWQFSRHRY